MTLMCVQTLLVFGQAVSKVPEYYLDILIVATLFSMIQSPYFLYSALSLSRTLCNKYPWMCREGDGRLPLHLVAGEESPSTS